MAKQIEITKLTELKLRARKLDETIADKDAKDYLLRLAKNWLGDVQHSL